MTVRSLNILGILLAAELSIGSNEPVLYIHTKGAANDNAAQPWVRALWYKYFIKDRAWLDRFSDGLCCIVLGPTGQTWFNAFVIYPDAAKSIKDNMILSDNRYYYEELPHNININVHALHYNVKPERIGCVVTI